MKHFTFTTQATLSFDIHAETEEEARQEAQELRGRDIDPQRFLDLIARHSCKSQKQLPELTDTWEDQNDRN